MSELKEYKCPNCGGKLEFDTQTQKLKCPFCEGTFDPDLFDEPDDFQVDSGLWEDSNLLMYVCKSCGGTIVADEQTAATSCPYCGNPVVVSGNVSGMYRPKKVIPFALNKEEAKEKYREFLKGKPLLPKSFRSEAIVDEIKGIYVPFWVFDGRAHASMWFDATRSHTWSDGEYNYHETSYYKVFRSGKVDFKAVPVDASSKILDELTESIEPFDYSKARDYTSNYLPGFFADKYDIDVEESKKIANSRIANSTRSLFSSTVTQYDTCTPSSSKIVIGNGRQDYVMYPVWLLNVKYKGRMHTFAMNGQTGKFVGELPTDTGRMISMMLGVFLGVTALASVIQYIIYLVR